MKNIPNNIIISRTDSIGDVVLTLPVAAVLKQHYPSIKIGFLGKAYTQPVINACEFVDEFIDVNDFLNGEITVCGEKPEVIIHVLPVAAIAKRAKKLKIPLRIGTRSRIYHWLTCNKLVKLSRKNSNLHEAQLNIKLLEPFGVDTNISLQATGELFSLNETETLPKQFETLLAKNKYNIILHPKSQGNGREWGLVNFIELVKLLDTEKFKIFISGIEKERELLKPLFDAVGNKVTDITGLMNLQEFIAFIKAADGLVASGTGPIHLAAALGKDALGIYPPIRPIHPGRWAPLGEKAQVFVLDKNCSDCKGKPTNCRCIAEVKPDWLLHSLLSSYEKKVKS